MALPKLEGRITIPTGGWQVQCSENAGARTSTVTIAAGDYYMSTSNGANASLFAALVNALAADATLLGTYGGSLDDNSDTSLGRLTISVSGGATAFALTWISTDLRDILGFTGNTSNAASATGSNQVRYLFLPNTGRANPLAPEPASSSGTYLGVVESDGTSALSPSGYHVNMQYSTRYRDSLEFHNLKGNKTWKASESTTNESFQKFWEDVIGQGIPFRYHSSRDSDAVYWTQYIENFQTYAPDAQEQGWVGANSLWRISYVMRPAL